MASNRGIQSSSLVLGVVIGFLLFVLLRNILFILVGVAIGALAVMYLRRR